MVLFTIFDLGIDVIHNMRVVIVLIVNGLS